MYSPYSGDSSASPPNATNTQGPSAQAGQDPYNRYSANPGTGYSPRPTYGQPPNTTGPPASQPSTGSYPPLQDYYRSEQVQVCQNFIIAEISFL